MLFLQYCVVCIWKIFLVIPDAWWNIILKTFIRSFLQHVPTVFNNYCPWLSLFLLRSCHKSISHIWLMQSMDYISYHWFDTYIHILMCFFWPWI
jgi:hypothetical protein